MRCDLSKTQSKMDTNSDADGRTIEGTAPGNKELNIQNADIQEAMQDFDDLDKDFMQLEVSFCWSCVMTIISDNELFRNS